MGTIYAFLFDLVIVRVARSCCARAGNVLNDVIPQRMEKQAVEEDGAWGGGAGMDE